MEAGTTNDFHACYLKHDLVYLMLPAAETRTLRIEGDGKISCKWRACVFHNNDEVRAVDAWSALCGC